MPYKPNERVYRAMLPLAVLPDTPQYHATGYASTFDRYMLFEDRVEGQVFEQIDRHAFDACDMSDVIMQFDHQGRVFARTSNGTLTLSTDDHGLKVEADLSLTNGSRELWEEINCKLITRMSFAFTIKDGHFDYETLTNRIHEIGKVFDVSAVSIPANQGTGIEARSLYDGEIKRALSERRATLQRLTLRTRLDALKYGG
ncbi:MAG: HK97 family phage prohead protease [Clostridia bacterium]|nr:HK97 family phage prohead protease [Clostridia bacterium]MBR0405544.1 HK97 family phage prohead protease [Eggerthellaceae bacterium]